MGTVTGFTADPGAATGPVLAAQILRDARDGGVWLDALPEEVRPRSLEEGYQVAEVVMSKRPPGAWGWKIAATSQAGRDHLRVDAPIRGRLHSGWVHEDGVEVSLEGNRMRLAELEIAFVMGRTLEPRQGPYATEEILEAVADVVLTIEVPDSRFKAAEEAGIEQLAADGACGWEIVVSAPWPVDVRTADLSACAVTGALERDGAVHEFSGSGANVLGGPVTALGWLVNDLSQSGLALLAGQTVTTGTTCTPVPVQPGDRLRGTFSGIGEISCIFV